MMKNILVLTDFSAGAAHAANCALSVAAKLRADVVLANIYPFTPYLPPAGVDSWPLRTPAEKKRESSAQLDLEIKRLTERLHRGRPVIRPLSLEGPLAAGVVELTRQKSFVLIITGISGKSYGNMFFEGDLKAVVEVAGCPVLAVPPAWAGEDFRHILLATDLAEEDQQVLGQLVKLSSPLKAQVSVCHVSPPVLIPDFAEEVRAATFAEKITDLYPGIRYYPARDTNILAALEQAHDDRRADMIAFRYQKHTAFYRLFHDNPLKEAIEHGKTPLLIFPENYHLP